MTPPLQYDPLRAYDLALVSKLGGVATASPQGDVLACTVLGLPKAVAVHFGLEEAWWRQSAPSGETVMLPALNVKRGPPLPAPARALPNWRGEELSTNPLTPNMVNVQRDPPQPVNLLYEVELVTSSQAAMNALLLHVMGRLPSLGYGTYLVVDGQTRNYHHTGAQDVTSYTTDQGRVFRATFEYTVEGWLAPTLECLKVPVILSIDVAVEAHKDQPRRTFLPPAEPRPASEADEVMHLVTNAPGYTPPDTSTP